MDVKIDVIVISDSSDESEEEILCEDSSNEEGEEKTYSEETMVTIGDEDRSVKTQVRPIFFQCVTILIEINSVLPRQLFLPVARLHLLF